MAETNGTNSPDRLDRIERIVEALSTTQRDMQLEQSEMRQELGVLLKSQVLMSDSLGKLIGTVGKLAEGQDRLIQAHQQLVESHQHLSEAQQHTEDRLCALIKIVDEIVRGRRPQ